MSTAQKYLFIQRIQILAPNREGYFPQDEKYGTQHRTSADI